MNNIGIIAIHGGPAIEPGTSEIATQIARDDFPLYINRDNEHITSTKFFNDEVKELLDNIKIVVSIHGERTTDTPFLMIGGLEKDLGGKIKQTLEKSGFIIKNPPENLAGDSINNICNKGRSGKGVQIEISEKLRNDVINDGALMLKLTEAIREALFSC